MEFYFPHRQRPRTAAVMFALLAAGCLAASATSLASCSEYQLHKDTDEDELGPVTLVFELDSGGGISSAGVRVCQLAGDDTILEHYDIGELRVAHFEIEGLTGSTFPDSRRLRVAAWDVGDGTASGTDPDYVSGWVSATDVEGEAWLAEGHAEDLGTLPDCEGCDLGFLAEIELGTDEATICDSFAPVELRIYLQPE